MKTAKKRPTTRSTRKKFKHEPHRRRPQPLYAYSRAYGPNQQTSNEPLEKTPRVMGVAAAEVAEVAEEAAVVAATEGTPPLREDHHQATPEEGTTDSLDNPRTYSQGIARKRKSSLRNGNSITI